MAREPKLDAESKEALSDLEAMRKEAYAEPKADAPIDEPKVEDKVEPKTEVKPEAKIAGEKTVPLAALHETREELKAERKRNEENQRKMDERLRLLTEAMQPKQPEQTQEPTFLDPEKDALGALKLNQKQIQELVEYKKNQENERQINQAREGLRMQAAQLESEFVKVTPDYNEASQYLIQSRGRELEASGMYSIPQINEILRNEAFALAQQAIQNGRNPAESVYAIAKARGYTPKQAQAAADAAAKTETEAEKLARIEAGQAASKSIGQAQGAQLSSGLKLDSKTLANMSDDEFAKVYNKLSRNERRNLMS